MAKSKDPDAVPTSTGAQPSRALLIELKGKMDSSDEDAAPASAEMFAALSIEEMLEAQGREDALRSPAS